MTAKFWIGLAVACSVGIAVGGWYTGRTCIGDQTAPGATDSRPDEFLEQGFRSLAEVGTEGRARADLLSQIAMRRQAEKPASAAATWEVLKKQLAQPAPDSASRDTAPSTSIKPDLDAVSRLLGYQDSLDDALLACRSLVDFDETWRVRDSVRDEIDLRRGRIANSLQADVQKFEQDFVTQTSDAVKTLQEFVPFKSRHEVELVSLIGTVSDAKSDESLQSVLELINQLWSCTNSYLKIADEEATKMAQRITEGEQIEPAREPTDAPSTKNDSEQLEPVSLPSDVASPRTVPKGPCEVALARLLELEEVLQLAQLDAWSSLLASVQPGSKPSSSDRHKDKDAQEKEGQESSPANNVAQRIGDIRLRWFRSQELAYNLWALRQLEAAESSDAWDDMLGRIDPGLLHPSVSALYTSLNSRLIDAVRDPIQRGHKVRRILTSKKVPLGRF